ncbi:isoprenylcysteine carboxylmethyltransferase family protein [Chelatococcus sp. SYSU_G07232]|uniref:Isoprenylcysteine carboxylmethyltransferase family protein n=1 Tax=Chelatococcus albus TaxID=3047466 RepID=A0ABT7AFV0_9HYPH|nr:isoprenylcysteine carboxylmethyltransferase family protein [Chelatococcus sp. SYSU_G07232]MDJ1157719.1 isoprenylcysteine carboxylmethyltransferase family protein [Chelatococcus sp. SYSU_G07232]
MPASAARQWINLTALAVVLLTLVALKAAQWADPLKGLLILLVAMALPIIGLEAWCTRHSGAGAVGPQARRRDDPDRPARVAIKLVGLLATYAAIGFAYWLLPLYRDGQAVVLITFVQMIAPPAVLVAPLYVWVADRRLGEPRDGCYMAGLAALGRWPEVNRDILRQYALGWLVKAFFLPIMIASAHEDLRWFLALDIGGFLRGYDFGWYEFAYRFLYFIEVFWAAAGYLMTLRLVGGHIRSAEPTLLGWVVCLACYAPFWGLLSRSYFAYDAGYPWGLWLADAPVVKHVWGVAILLLLAVYAWSTIAFGIRFSNLTHRGILTNGPYRWTKHPAYISKNLTWWLIAVPFAAQGGTAEALRQCLMLLGVNAIYFMRARTEERHLARDPDYRAYAAWIAEHGLFARARRLLAEMLGRRMAVGSPAEVREVSFVPSRRREG